MPPYTGPNKEIPSYGTNFIRIEDSIYIEPVDKTFYHSDIVYADQLAEQIGRLRLTRPDELDAGFLGFITEPPNSEIIVSGNSTGLEIPVRRVMEEARDKTRSLIEKLSPDYRVVLGD